MTTFEILTAVLITAICFIHNDNQNCYKWFDWSCMTQEQIKENNKALEEQTKKYEGEMQKYNLIK